LNSGSQGPAREPCFSPRPAPGLLRGVQAPHLRC
jgi:hypothetical protein